MSKNLLFYCPPSSVSRIADSLNLTYTKERLLLIVKEDILRLLRGCTVEVEVESAKGGKPNRQSFDRWIGKTHSKNYSDKFTLLRILALIFVDPRNTRQWFALLPPANRKLFTTTIEQLIITQKEANKIMGIKSSPIDSSSYYYSSYRVIDHMNKTFPWFDCYIHYGRYYDERPVFYLSLPKEVFHLLARGLSDNDKELTCDAPAAEAIINTESETLAHLPVIIAMFKQGLLTIGKTKLVMKSTINTLTKLNMTPIPSPLNKATLLREQLLGYATAVGFAYHRKELCNEATPPEQVVKKLVRVFNQHIINFFPIATQHVSGVRRGSESEARMGWLWWSVTSLLKSIPSAWLDMETMWRSAKLMLGENVYALLGCDFASNSDEARVNLYNGIEITPDLQLQHFGVPIFRALVCLLASVGVVEVATAHIDRVVSPFDGITAVRLTGLGRYVFDIDDTYTAPSVDSSPDFEVSPTHLIIRVLKPDTPLLYILKSMATETGNNRWVVTAKSFLAGCQTPSDVNQQIDLFKKCVCAEPSPVWLAFFESLVQRAKPLVSESLSQYRLYRFDPSNESLRQLLDSDEQLRTLITRVEGYRLLIHNSDYVRFTKRLKELGYIL